MWQIYASSMMTAAKTNALDFANGSDSPFRQHLNLWQWTLVAPQKLVN